MDGLLGKLAGTVNAGVLALRASPLGGPIRRSLTIVSYEGRRSGRTFSTPVAFRRRGEDVEIRVEMPDKKRWWRNFTGDGGPLRLELDGAERSGHAVARRDGRQVVVAVTLS
ncbi:hypothetical protein GCM10009836_08540 [Pseudonocardia ailaonensis]|uniref:DUF385 domain-containing protein n=1 Tax=Pseudonocardia ailaonensis TaxID=367279 RepID=A0ABN2MNH7_9PSEU